MAVAEERDQLKTIGIIGGMSWESTVTYYQHINRSVKAALGGLHSAKVIVYSVDFADMAQRQGAGDWQGAAQDLILCAQALSKAGAEVCVIATNTMHKVVGEVASAIDIPLLHIADATGTALQNDGRRKPALLGTRFTMEEAFYRAKLERDYGLEVMTPAVTDREVIHRVIYEELCVGQLEDASREAYRSIIKKLVAQGADSVILGCTEIPLLINQGDVEVPLYDTTALHAQAAVEFALAEAG